MERELCLTKLPLDLRQLILQFLDLHSLISVIECSKQLRLDADSPVVYKHVYFNSFADFNPKLSFKGNSNWQQELKNKVSLYGTDYNKHRDLIGVVKIRFEFVQPLDLSPGKHIHSKLEFLIDDNLLPLMGYFGANDVCFRDWIVEVFTPLLETFDTGGTEHTWDFCDQGMPAFQFVKDGPVCRLSIIEGMCGGQAHEDWQNIPFLIEDFRVEYINFLEELYVQLMRDQNQDGAKKFWVNLKVNMSKNGKFIKFDK